MSSNNSILIFQSQVSTAEVEQIVSNTLDSVEVEYTIQNHTFQCIANGENFDIVILKQGISKSVWLRDLKDEEMANSILMEINKK